MGNNSWIKHVSAVRLASAFSFSSPGDENQGVQAFDKFPEIYYFIGSSAVNFI